MAKVVLNQKDGMDVLQRKIWIPGKVGFKVLHVLSVSTLRMVLGEEIACALAR